MATYLVNRIPSRILGYKTPYELVYGKTPDLTNRKKFGSLAYVIDLKHNDKFQARSIPCVFLGFPEDEKGIFLSLRKRESSVVDMDMKNMFWFDPEEQQQVRLDTIEFAPIERRLDTMQSDSNEASREKTQVLRESYTIVRNRPARERQPPIWSKDYVRSLIETEKEDKYLYNINKYVSSSK
ncbi:hypothetical protein QN277_027069 [Acacia crassicarpa]|uniref:Uncharacterized protein n=1 Tax=Acacia crassicarpa TaxID=499986 RepID=A0AAE1JDH0_9FABA|nr:hypothetical protein QN277_027069 [Acacia crassicarpa]